MNRLAYESSSINTQIKKPSSSTTHKDSALLANPRIKGSALKILQLSTNQKYNTIDMADIKPAEEPKRIEDENLTINSNVQAPYPGRISKIVN